MNKKTKILKLTLCVLFCQTAGIVGALFTFPSIPTWYANLHKPAFNPPSWIFAPVWTLLFLLMGISAFLIWNKTGGNKKVKTALLVFILQLALNTLWSVLFFGLRSPLYAFGEIILLWLTIIATILNFYQISKAAAFMLLPYFLWVSFAIILNFAIVILN